MREWFRKHAYDILFIVVVALVLVAITHAIVDTLIAECFNGPNGTFNVTACTNNGTVEWK